MLDFENDSIVQVSHNCKIFTFQIPKKKRNKPATKETTPSNLVKRSIVMEEVQILLIYLAIKTTLWYWHCYNLNCN